jgi:hypothetical protein
VVERCLGDPMIKIIIDDYLTLADGPAQDTYSFDIDIPDESHTLKIIHYGKTIQDATNNNVDKHVEISAIRMDQVQLEAELWAGKFFPVYLHKADHEPYYISPNLYLGHNGTWSLDFATPAITWLINIRQPGPQLGNTIFKTNQQILNVAKEFFKGLPDV